MTIFTFGYGNRTNHRQLIKYFNEYKIEYLIDVRLKPYGWSALWHCNQLDTMCQQNGVQYISRKELGNTSGKPEWIPEDRRRASKALNDVAELCEESNIILMCSELDVRKCHRKAVAEKLEIITGKPILHLA